MTSTRHYPKGEAKREEILALAFDLFARKGHDQTSFREIARAAGLTQAGLLHYFPSKEDLLVEILRYRDLREAERVGTEFDLDALALAVEYNATIEGLIRLYTLFTVESTSAGHAASAYFAERHERVHGQLVRALRDRYGDDGPDADMLATLIVAAVDGLQVQWLRDPRIDMAAHLRYLYSLLPEPA